MTSDVTMAKGDKPWGHALLRRRKYRDLRRREFGKGGRIDLRAILNEPKPVKSNKIYGTDESAILELRCSAKR
jgi:hypothetical protein